MSNYDWKNEGNYQEIFYETYDGIAKITINRPERRNAFTPLTNQEMFDAFSRARDDSSIGIGNLVFGHVVPGMDIGDQGDDARQEEQDAEAEARRKERSERIYSLGTVFAYGSGASREDL